MFVVRLPKAYQLNYDSGDRTNRRDRKVMNEENLVTPGHKFALLAIRCRRGELPPRLPLAPDVLATTSSPVEFGNHWKEWLGTIRFQNFQDYKLFFITTSMSKNPDILDNENRVLHERLWRLLVGLLLAGRTAFEKPDFMLGAHGSHGLSVRQIGEHELATEILGLGADPIDADTLERAWTIARQIDGWNGCGPAWRINRVLTNFVETRAILDIPDRIHQFCRCIEGFILPDAGDTRKQFKSRTEMFIGPEYHDLMGQIYDVRSKVEHLHHQKLFDPAERGKRLALARYAAILEAIARNCITRLLSTPDLWPHFRTDDALQAFWRLPADERRALWGTAVPPADAIKGFQEDRISDEALGLPAHP